MAEKITFSVQPRTIIGKGVKKLRQDRIVPANITIPNEPSVQISVNESGFAKLYDQVGDTGLIYLTVEGEKATRPVLVEDIQAQAVSGRFTHVVFKQVNLKEKITAEIPVEVIGESSVPDAILVTVHDSIEVEALPADLPEKFVIDASKLTEFGQVVTFAELEYDSSKVKLQITAEEMSSPVVMLQEHKEEVVEETTAAAEPAEGAATEAPASEGADAAKAE